jgi:hypothetical protein
MSVRESDDDYGKVVARLGSDRRVIVCADDIQWIVQRRSGSLWRSLHYCTSREGVIRRVKGLPGWEALLGLPARFDRRADGSTACTERKVAPPGTEVAPEAEEEVWPLRQT